jgi:hypothetical protein
LIEGLIGEPIASKANPGSYRSELALYPAQRTLKQKKEKVCTTQLVFSGPKKRRGPQKNRAN